MVSCGDLGKYFRKPCFDKIGDSLNCRRLYCARSSRCVWRSRGAKKNEIGRSAGGFSTKIHALVDSRGRHHYLEILPGQAHDISRAENLLQRAKGKSFIGDKAYHSKSLIQAVQRRGMKFVVPCKNNHVKKRRHSASLYAKRIYVEWFFHKLKSFQGVATRYCKTAKSFISSIHVACMALLAF